MGIVHLVIIAVIVVAVVALFFVFCRATGVSPPAWLIEVFWIIVAAVVVIWAIKFIAGMW